MKTILGTIVRMFEILLVGVGGFFVLYFTLGMLSGPWTTTFNPFPRPADILVWLWACLLMLVASSAWLVLMLVISLGSERLQSSSRRLFLGVIVAGLFVGAFWVGLVLFYNGIDGFAVFGDPPGLALIILCLFGLRYAFILAKQERR